MHRFTKEPGFTHALNRVQMRKMMITLSGVFFACDMHCFTYIREYTQSISGNTGAISAQYAISSIFVLSASGGSLSMRAELTGD